MTRLLELELSRLVSRLEEESDGDRATTDRLLAAASRFGDLARTSAELQAEAVRSAHAEGVSWARIGAHLGISRQAVQQRFDPNYDEEVPGDVEGRILGPVTRAEELTHLEAAGADGWRPIRSLHGEHVMRRDGGPWEVRRVSVFTAGSMPAEADGWQPATMRFPDCFYIRERSAAASSDAPPVTA